VRTRKSNGEYATIVIDAGKTFQQATLQWFPRYGLRKIDAVLITHGHADAMNGLDDLRGWTLNGAIQSHIDLYCSQATYAEVQRAFPYLVSKEHASGGGDVPTFRWHIIEDMVPFEVGDTGITVTPFTVHHGRFLSDKPIPEFVPTPTDDPTVDQPTTEAFLSKVMSGVDGHANGLANGSSTLPRSTEKVVQPYLSLGFAIEDRFVYISDVSHIPERSWNFLTSFGIRDGENNRIPFLALDCLRLASFSSHYGIADAVDTTRKLNPRRTLLLGFCHDLTHDEYVNICRHVSGELSPKHSLPRLEREGISLVPNGDAVWMRPAYDGQRVFIAPNGRVRFGDVDDEQ